jgi:hypothetical protein
VEKDIADTEQKQRHNGAVDDYTGVGQLILGIERIDRAEVEGDQCDGNRDYNKKLGKNFVAKTGKQTLDIHRVGLWLKVSLNNRADMPRHLIMFSTGSQNGTLLRAERGRRYKMHDATPFPIRSWSGASD